MNENFSIIWSTRQIRNQQLSVYLTCAVKQLKGMGIKPGDRIAICDDNSVEYIILLLALWQIRAVAAPINPRWPEKTIISYASRISARHIFYSAEIKRAVCFDARQQVEAAKLQQIELDQEVTIIATSGSSGEAKAAVHSWGNHYYSARGSAEVIPLSATDRWVLSLPLYHVSGLAITVRCLIAGSGLVIVNDSDLILAIKQGKATHLSMVAMQLQKLLIDENNHALLASLKCILLGGSSIPKALIEEAVKLGLNIYLSYGLTEMSSQVATGKVGSDIKVNVKILPYRELTISPDGEILVRGEVLFKGYITGNKLSLPSTIDHWFPTGDMGYLDKTGNLSVTGRRDSMFISGGENIHPEEIEKALLTIKGIEQAIVVPKEDKEYGQRPIAFIKFIAEPVPEGEIIQSLQAVLPKFKIPIAFLPWPQSLITQSLKISRQEFLKYSHRR